MQKEILHQTKIDYETTGDAPESQLRLTRRGRLSIAVAGLALGLGIASGVGMANNSEAGNSIPLRTAQITMDQPNFTAIAKSLPGYSPESTNLNEVIYEIRQLNPDLDPGKLRPGTQVIVPNLEQ